MMGIVAGWSNFLAAEARASALVRPRRAGAPYQRLALGVFANQLPPLPLVGAGVLLIEIQQ